MYELQALVDQELGEDSFDSLYVFNLQRKKAAAESLFDCPNDDVAPIVETPVDKGQKAPGQDAEAPVDSFTDGVEDGIEGSTKLGTVDPRTFYVQR